MLCTRSYRANKRHSWTAKPKFFVLLENLSILLHLGNGVSTDNTLRITLEHLSNLVVVFVVTEVRSAAS